MEINEQIQRKANPDYKIASIRDVLKEILRLDYQESEWRSKNEDYVSKIKATLAHLENDFKEMLEQNPTYINNPDFINLKKMYADLKADFEAERKLDLDSSLETILKEAQNLIQAYPLIDSEEIPYSNTKKLSNKLKELDIFPEYAVLTKNIHAPIVILTLHVHPNPNMSKGLMEASGILKSQTEVENNIHKLTKNKLLETIYAEWLELDTKIPEDEKWHPALIDSKRWELIAKVKLGKEIKIEGIEEMEWLQKTFREFNTKHRMTVNNIFIAKNLAQQMTKKWEQISMLTMGLLHEKWLKWEHPLPLSKCLAEAGINVLVVNTANHFDPQKILDYLKNHPEDQSDLFESIQEELKKIDKKTKL